MNALLILVAAAAATFGVCALVWSQVESNMRRHSIEAAAPAVPGKQATPELRLGGFAPVDGTSLYRAILSTSERSVSSFSSGGYSETRNILVLDGAAATSHWLLPTDKELIVFNQDVGGRETQDGRPEPPVATVFLVKAYSSNPEAEEGRAFVSDLAATDVRELASGVREVCGASLNGDGKLAILYEQKRYFHLALLDVDSRRVLSDRVVVVPALK